MSDDLQPVAPAENEEPVEQAPVADVAAPVVEATDSEEVLAEIEQAKIGLIKLLDIAEEEIEKIDGVLARLEDDEDRHGDPDELVSVRLKDGHPDCMIPGAEGFVSGVVIKMTRARLAELAGAYFIEVIDENRKEGL